jgi:hypothetical protein
VAARIPPVRLVGDEPSAPLWLAQSDSKHPRPPKEGGRMTLRYTLLLQSVQARDQATILLALFAVAFIAAYYLMRTNLQRSILICFYIAMWITFLLYYGFGF